MVSFVPAASMAFVLQTCTRGTPSITAISQCQRRAIFGPFRTSEGLDDSPLSSYVTDGQDPRQSTPRVYTVMQLADILQIDPRTVRAKARSGAWSSLSFGPKTIRFTEAHLTAILAGEEPAVQPAVRRTTRQRRPS